MNEIEKILHDQKAAPASDDFDARMRNLLTGQAPKPPRLLRRQVRLWHALAASLLFGTMGFLLGDASTEPMPEPAPAEPVTTLYIIEPQPAGVRNTFELAEKVKPFYRPPAPPVITQSVDSDTNPASEKQSI